MSHATKSTSHSGCGCNGSSSTSAVRAGNALGSAGSCGGGCACGGRGCALCQGQDYARPRFFAGQLLTEDDLDLLASHSVEKSRLHNRSFLGEGVVCGLMVTCDPCGGGKVTVQPGYALDCCGNDVVVPCAQTLDINLLVKRLRIEKTGGVDCGDPCAEERARPEAMLSRGTAASGTAASATAASASVTGASAAGATASVPPLAPAEYCLYVRYCEQLTDPVSPYATDDPCGAAACEATRVREGFRFELRCRSCEEHPADNLFSRIGDCFGDVVTAAKTASHTRSLLFHNANLSQALQRMSSGKPAAFLDNRRLEDVTKAVARAGKLPESADKWTAVDALDAADTAQTLASFVAAWETTTSRTGRRARDNEEPDIQSLVKDAKGGLDRIASLTSIEMLRSLIDDEFDRDLTVATAQGAVPWRGAPAPSDSERKFLAGGFVFNGAVRTTYTALLAQLKATLINRLEARGALTDCTLLKEVRSIALPSDANDLYTHGILAASAGRRILDALGRYLRECVCAAINPPCPPCEDPGVLLACLRVEGCEVVDICNLERTFVLTPTTLRYWLPFLHSIGNIIESQCCPDKRCDTPDEPKPPPVSTLPTRQMEERSALVLTNRLVGPSMPLDPALIAALLPRQFSFSPEKARAFARSAAAMTDIAGLRHGVTLGDLIDAAIPQAFRGVLPPRVAAAAEPPKPGSDLKRVRSELADLREKLARSDKANRDLAARIKKLEK